jgi:hypothetical protein
MKADIISKWFDDGLKKGHKYMLVMCDTYDWEDYPEFADSDNDCLFKYNKPGKMQKVMEVYDLAKDKNEQMRTARVLNLPSTPQLIRWNYTK